MRSKQAIKEAQKRYEASGAVKAVTKQITLKLHIVHDADILKHLESVENVNGYLKSLIRQDITTGG